MGVIEEHGEGWMGTRQVTERGMKDGKQEGKKTAWVKKRGTERREDKRRKRICFHLSYIRT